MKSVIILSFLFCLSLTSFGQEMKILSKYQDDKLFLRWIPSSAQNWLDGTKDGYIIETYKEGILIDRTVEAIFPAPFDEVDFESSVTMGIPAQVMYYLTHLDRMDQESINETYPPEEYSREEILEDRHLSIQMFSNYNFYHSDIAGLGYVVHEIEENTNYSFMIFQAGKDKRDPKYGAEIRFNSNANLPRPEVPELEAKWTGKRAELRWNSEEAKDHFWGYKKVSKINGGPEIWSDTLPTINAYVGHPEPALHIIKTEEYLRDNETEYTFRIYGIDYFGNFSEDYSEVIGNGRLGIGLSPNISESVQLETNEVHLKWEILDKFKKHIKHWHIYTAESYEGPYELDTSIFDSNIREAIRPIPFNATYFVVAVEDDRGEQIESFPQLVMSYDSIPPATPHNLEGRIDTNGIVKITWSSNDEEDFLGYKVFFANDTTMAWGLPHPGHLPDPIFTDTINLKTTQEEIYFKITAVDERNNRSPFSEILILKRPDILAPVQAEFFEIKPLPGKIALKWHLSPSEDVSTQRLYRKEKSDNEWTAIKEWNQNEIENTFIDSLVEPKVYYFYLLTVTDDAGLVSDPSQPISSFAFKDYNSFPIDAFEVQYTSQKEIQIDCQFPTQELFEILIYKTTNEGPPRMLRRISNGQIAYVDTNIKEDNEYLYFIQVVFDDGVKSAFSNSKEPQKL